MTRVFCIAPFNNPHIVPLYDALARRTELNVTRACLAPLPDSRLRLGWPEMAADAPYLQPWRRKNEWVAYVRELVAADVTIFPGFHHFRTLPLHHWLRRLSGKPSLLWSEAFIGHHNRPWWHYAGAKLLRLPCDDPSVHLLAIGGRRAAQDYVATGSRRWGLRNFVMVVEPPKVAGCDSCAGSADGKVRLLYCGALVDRKRVDLLVTALASERLRDLPWTLRIVGDGEQRTTLERTVAERGLRAKIEFCGALPRQECDAAYRTSDILVLPSRFDGWGAVVNEAMEHGLAVVCSDAVGASVLVENGRSGFVFPSGTTQGLIDALHVLLTDSARLAAMRRSGRERIEQFRPRAVAERLSKLCRSLAGDAQGDLNGDWLLASIRLDRRSQSWRSRSWSRRYA